MTTKRQNKLSEFRAKWAIKQQEAHQLKAAIDVLYDTKLADSVALKVAEDIVNANIGP